MEKLSVELNDKLCFKPPVIGYLASINEGELSYNYYRLTHPAGIFNKQFSSVVDDFLDLLNHLNELQNNQDFDRVERLGTKFTSLLSSFFKYYESCYEIILACCKEHDPPKKDFIHRWLKQNNYSAGKFLHENVNDDISYFREMFNKLKHTSNKIRLTYFDSNQTKIFGYYVESAKPDGSLGPDEKLHPKYKNTNSANSFNFDLRKLYYCTYKIAETLLSALNTHFNDVYSINLKHNTDYKDEDSKAKQLYEKIVSLPTNFFPNEFNKSLPFPVLEVNDVENIESLIFKIKYTKPIILNGHFWMGTRGDGFTRSFRPPFFNLRF